MLSARTSGEAPFSVKNHALEKKVVAIVMCESGSKEDAWGDCDKTGIQNAKHCRAFGIAQFHSPSFDMMKKQANMPELDRNKTQDQLKLLRWALQNNLQNHWSCYKKIYGNK